jgi:hypothetical protein
MPTAEVYGGMSTEPLFRWLMKTPFAYTWWLWAVMGVLVALAANTLFCSVESLVKKRSAFLIVVAPQVIHLGFLCILLAHLVSSLGGFRLTGGVPEGGAARLPNGVVFRLERLEAQVTAMGYLTDWKAKVSYISEGNVILKEDVIAPNRPSFNRGVGLYLKDLRLEPSPVALIEASREPGAPWALAGAVLFTLGTAALLIMRVRQE